MNARAALLLAAVLVAALALVPVAGAYIPREPLVQCFGITAKQGQRGGIQCVQVGWERFSPPSRPAPGVRP